MQDLDTPVYIVLGITWTKFGADSITILTDIYTSSYHHYHRYCHHQRDLYVEISHSYGNIPGDDDDVCDNENNDNVDNDYDNSNLNCICVLLLTKNVFSL